MSKAISYFRYFALHSSLFLFFIFLRILYFSTDIPLSGEAFVVLKFGIIVCGGRLKEVSIVLFQSVGKRRENRGVSKSYEHEYHCCLPHFILKKV